MSNDDTSAEKVKEKIESIIEICRRVRFIETKNIFDQLLDEFEKTNKLNIQLLDDSENVFTKEITSIDLTYRKSLIMFKKILTNVHDKRKKSGKNFLLLEDETSRLSTLKNSLEIIFKEMKSVKSKNTDMLLRCLAFVIQYETNVSSTGWMRIKIRELIGIASPIKTSEMDKIIEEMITIKLTGSDGKADTTHIRNSISHGRFELINNNSIKFCDVDMKGNKTFEITLSYDELVTFNQMFERKLGIIIYYSFVLELYAQIRKYSIKTT